MAEADAFRDVPSRFFVKQIPALRAAARRGPVLDLACGRGRHAIAAAREGWTVIAVDRNRESLAQLRQVEILGSGSIETVECDLESGQPWSLGTSRFAVIIVSRYLHRPLMAAIEAALQPAALLLYETFTTAQRSLGWGPKRHEFLLELGELPTLFPDLRPLTYEEGLSADEPAAQTARLLARRPD